MWRIEMIWAWWVMRYLEVQAYLTWHTDDTWLAQDIDCQARRARDKYELLLIQRRMGL